MVTANLDYRNRLSLTADIGEDATLEELFSAIEKHLKDRRSELLNLVTRKNSDALAFLQAEASYLEPPI